MNQRQIQGVLTTLRTNYVTAYKNLSLIDQKNMLDLWYASFRDDDPQLVNESVLAYIDEDQKGFPPTIGQIKGIMRKMNRPDGDAIADAWDQVAKVGRQFTRYSEEDRKLYETLPDKVKMAISYQELREWGDTDYPNTKESIRQNFMKTYSSISDSERYNALANKTNGVKEIG